EDDVVGGEALLALGGGDRHLVRAHQAGGAHHDVGAVALEELADAAGELLDDLALPRLELAHVDGDVAGDDHAHVAGVLDLLDPLGGGDQGLAGDAADVEADAAEVLLLDDEGSDAELGEADAARV